jgi:FAD/FMN-containing dehydrogenase
MSLGASVPWPAFTGELRTDAERLGAYATDFGRLSRAMPLAVLRPADLDDVARAVRFARAQRLKVVSRGHAHTTRGQALCRGGLVIDLRSLDRVHEVGADSVRVQAGARWVELLRATLKAGLTPPVLTDYIDLSVAGTISVGGVGGQSFRYGLQADNVLELVVVTGAGELVRCSSQRDAALFDACRAGLGQFGIIVEAKLKLVPAPEKVRVFALPYPDLSSFLRAQLELVEDGRFDYVLGNLNRTNQGGAGISAWSFSLECVHYFGVGAASTKNPSELVGGLDLAGDPRWQDVDFFGYANRLAAMEAAMKQAGTWQGVHPWTDLFLPASQAGPVIEATLGELEHDEVDGGYVMTYPLVRRRCRTTLPGLPAEDRVFLFDMLLGFDDARVALLPGVLEKCERLLARARRIGATVYPIGFPVGTPGMQTAHWRQQIGSSFDALAQLKRDVDPDGILQQQLAIFG